VTERTGVPELPRRNVGRHRATRTTRPRRYLVGLCTAAVTTLGGLSAAQVGHADPDLTLEEVKERVDELHHEAGVAAERYHQATDELEDVQRRLAKAQERVKRQEARLKELITEVGGFAAATYRTGGIDPTLEVLLADDPEEYLAKASVVDAYSKQQAEQLLAVAGQRQRLEQDTLLADEELSRLEAIEAQLDEEKVRAEKLLADAERLLDGLQAEERARLEREEAERAAAAARESRTSDRADDAPSTSDVPASGRGQAALNFALAQVGKPYAWGGNGPNSYDCSGLTRAAWAAAGVSLPRSSHQQIGVGTRVSYDQMRPGDLVFFYSPISHVAMYAGNGQIVHAVRSGVPVRVDSLEGHYRSNLAGVSRPG
jgi:peptidoglycan DL-endopeptidase CwlO